MAKDLVQLISTDSIFRICSFVNRKNCSYSKEISLKFNTYEWLTTKYSLISRILLKVKGQQPKLLAKHNSQYNSEFQKKSIWRQFPKYWIILAEAIFMRPISVWNSMLKKLKSTL